MDSLRFIQILKDSSLRQSMSRRGNCWDNAPQESFFGHMKDEIDLSECETFDQVKAVIDDWIDYYNNDRLEELRQDPVMWNEVITAFRDAVARLDFKSVWQLEGLNKLSELLEQYETEWLF